MRDPVASMLRPTSLGRVMVCPVRTAFFGFVRLSGLFSVTQRHRRSCWRSTLCKMQSATCVNALDSAAVGRRSVPVARRSPTVRERRLARRLRQLREDAASRSRRWRRSWRSPPPPSRAWRPPRWACDRATCGTLLDIYERHRGRARPAAADRARTAPAAVVAGVHGPAQHRGGRARGRRLDHLAVLDPARARAAPDRGLCPRRARGHPARRQARRHRPSPRAADPSAGAAHERARPRVLGGPRRGRRAPAGRRADGHGRAARAPDRGDQAAQRHPPGAAVHQRRPCRDGRRVHRPPLPRVLGPRRGLHREHRERSLPREPRGDPQVQQDLRSPAGRGAEPGRVHPDPRNHPVSAGGTERS